MDWIVCTTINEPTFLWDYHENLKKFGNLDKVGVVVVGDQKEHENARKVIADVQAAGLTVEYLDVAKQEAYLAKWPEVAAIIPWKSDNRRNVGYLWAVEHGAERVISIDDDNFPLKDENFYGAHSVVGASERLHTIKSENNWVNICRLLDFNYPVPVYPRGFPHKRRFKDTFDVRFLAGFEKEDAKRITLSAGLWTEDPDVDAITRLTLPVQGEKYNQGDQQFVLGTGQSCPINTQNTCFHRDVLPAYYFVLMSEQGEGNFLIHRFGDIWSGFFAKKVVDAMGDAAAIGRPVCSHRRNVHDILDDLRVEMNGMLLTEKLCDFLEEVTLTRTESYCDAYEELAEKLRMWVEGKREELAEPEFTYMLRVTDCMKVWCGVSRKILAQ